MSVRIVVDSTCDLRPALRQRVRVVPLTVFFGDEEYLDGVNLSAQEFYRKLSQTKVFPRTSQASPFAFSESFAEAVHAGDSVVCITVSSKLSGTYQSAVIAAEDYPGRVFVVDSRQVAISCAVMAEYALELAEEGKTAEEIAAELTALRDKVKLLAVVDTLEYLHRGGRLSKTVAIAGGLLSLKPIIGVVDGEVKMVGKARGNKASNRAMNQQIEALGVDTGKPILLGYTGLDDALLRKYVAECGEFWPKDTPAMLVSGVIGAHAGPGAVAAAFFSK
ncbi:MAG: DegV family protein [Oscillospiraceae bacterium]|nr:DegV family protein [Oscillospiraceae bacterium]